MSPSGKKLLIMTAVGTVCALALSWGRGLFSAADARDVLRILSDGFFVVGGLLLAWGGIVWSSNGGAFDGLSWSVKTLVWRVRPDYDDVKQSFAEYREQREKKARSPKVSILSGVILLVPAFLLMLVYNWL